MANSLRLKLMFSYVALVFVIFFLAAIASGAILTSTQRSLGYNRAENTILVLAQRVRTSRSPRQAAENLLQFGAGLREPLLLIASDGSVLASTGQGAEEIGTQIPPPPYASEKPPMSLAQAPIYTRAWSSPLNQQRYYLAYAEVEVPMQMGASGRYLVVAIPARDVDLPWRRLIGFFLILGSVVLIVAASIGYTLARSITGPLHRMTTAAEAMAHGNYQQRLSVHGNDEVAHLAASFNRMTEAVDRTNRAQRDLLANVSHDLRTPLTSIDGFSQAILEGAIQSEDGYLKAAKIIHDETQRMQHLITDLIDIAKLEGGVLDIAPQPLDFNELVNIEVSQSQVHSRQTGLTLKMILGTLPPIYGDPNRIRQVVRNLLDNAIKYARPQTTIQVTTVSLATPLRTNSGGVAFGDTLRSGSWVSLAISNETDLIDPLELARVFDRFYRGDKSRSQREGSGLGLAIVREVVLAHGGRVEARSAESATTFTIWLPTSAGTTKR
ncbi:MAG: sensor histidine kinase [Anaerolineae bacterium]